MLVSTVYKHGSHGIILLTFKLFVLISRDMWCGGYNAVQKLVCHVFNVKSLWEQKRSTS